MNKIRISIDSEIMKKNQTEILNLKNKISILNASLEDFKGNFKQAEERLSKVEDRSFEVIV